MAIEFHPLLPLWAIALVVAGLLTLLGQGCRVLVGKRVPARWIVNLAILRVVIVAVLAVCLLRPVVSARGTVTQRPRLMVMLDTSASMAAGQVDAKAIEALSERLSERYDLTWYTFDAQARAAENAAAATATAPEGLTTRYATSLMGAWNLLQQRAFADWDAGPSGGLLPGAPVRVVLVSDGNDHDDVDVVSAARDLGVTIDVLAAGGQASAGEQATARITSVQGPPRTLLGSELRFLATIQLPWPTPGNRLFVDLSEDGVPVRSYEVAIPTTGAGDLTETQANLSYRPAQAGLHRYGLTVRTDAAAAPTKPVEIGVLVVSDQLEVLLIEDTWRWSFKYLRRMLEDDPNFSLTAFIARTGPTFMQFAEPGRRVNLGGFPQSRSELSWFDTIILGDVDPARWPSTLPAAIRDLVVEEGKTLIIQAGPNLSNLMRYGALASLLPVDLSESSARPIIGPLPVRLTVEGSASPIFFAADAQSAALWRNLPAVDHVYPALRKKPGATVLVEASQQANEAGRLVVVAEQVVGKGRVMFIATDTLWKWQMLGPQTPTGLTPYTLFWQQALRALSPKQTGSPGMKLEVSPDRGRYREGQTVVLRARLRAEQLPREAVVTATLTGTGVGSSTALPVVFVPDADDPSAFEARLAAPGAGVHSAQVTVQAAGQTLAQTVAVVDVEPARTEAEDLAINHANLQRIAQGTGGRVIDPADPATWPTTDPADRRRVVRERTVDLWGSFMLPVLLTLLLGMDWLLRLVRGYV